jgi:hypothetical protein
VPYRSPLRPLCCPSFSTGLFSRPPAMCFQRQHVIGFLLTVVILIVCFSYFSFGFFCLFFFFFFSLFACFSIAISLYVFFCLFLLFGCFFHFCPFISMYVFSFMFLLVIRLYPLKLFSIYEYICIWSRPLGCGCKRYLSFWVEEDEYWLEGSLLSRPRNKCYLCIEW